MNHAFRQDYPMTNAETLLDEITAAYRDALAGKTVKFNNREWTRHDLPVLRAEMQHWSNVVARENGGGHKPMTVIL
jgi:hypothetical protein